MARITRVPGIGSYMSVAQEQNNGWAQVWAVTAMMAMIVALDQLVWRPLLVWSNKFKLEDTESEYQDRSAVLRFLSRSRVGAALQNSFASFFLRPGKPAPPAPLAPAPLARTLPSARSPRGGRRPTTLWRLRDRAFVLASVQVSEWLIVLGSLLCTLARVLSAIAISTLIAVPIGVWIGSNPRLARFLMPLTQMVASFPSPLVFPNIAMLIYFLHGNLQWGAVVLMIFGTIWYILFNVIAGASAIPQDLRACADLTHLRRWQKWRTLWLPGIFPALTTGWITAAGGAWNASIVSEYVQYRGTTHTALGLGSLINDAQAKGHFPVLAASVLAMALFVVVFNRLVWKRLSAYAQDRFQLLT